MLLVPARDRKRTSPTITSTGACLSRREIGRACSVFREVAMGVLRLARIDSAMLLGHDAQCLDEDAGLFDIGFQRIRKLFGRAADRCDSRFVKAREKVGGFE